MEENNEKRVTALGVLIRVLEPLTEKDRQRVINSVMAYLKDDEVPAEKPRGRPRGSKNRDAGVDAIAKAEGKL